MSDPRQLNLFDAKGQAPAPPPPAAIPPAQAPAEPREALSLGVGDTFLKRVEGYAYGEASFWQSVADGAGDGFLQHDCYVLVRFHQDPDAKVYRRKVKAKDIERDLDWAIEVTLFHEAQSYFYHFTGNARPRCMTERELRNRFSPVTIRAAEKPVAPVPAKGGPSAEDVDYVQAAILDILPKGWPSYAKEVLRVRRVPSNGKTIFVRTHTAIVATLRLFDGEIGRLRLEGVPGAHGYSWKLGRRDTRPFQFDEAAWAWGRVDEPDA